MTEKDNANPIIHSQDSLGLNNRRSSNSKSEWWRDPSIHSTVQPASTLSFNLDNQNGAQDEDEAFEEDDDEEYDGTEGKPKKNVSKEEVLDNVFPTYKMSKKLDGEKIDSQEIYDLIRSITDPEHPLTLEQLAVVNASHITVDHGDPNSNKLPHVLLEFTPTIPHCSMATLIGLSLRVRLLRSLPDRYKIDIRVRPGTHQSENAVNKQLNDKERVAAALENAHLFNVVQGCLSSAARRGRSEEDVRREFESGAQGTPMDANSIWKTVEDVAARMGLQV